MEPTLKTSTTVRTTLPALTYAGPTDAIRSARLTLRAYLPEDLAALTALRSQPEGMVFSPSGKPSTPEATRRFLEAKLASQQGHVPLDRVVCLRGTDELIGLCGVYARAGALGWPAVGYRFSSEVWGQGYATEALSALVDAYWALPREEQDVVVDESAVAEPGDVVECLTAVVTEDNAASMRVLDKCGFKLRKIWAEPDLRDETRMIRLYHYVLAKPTL